MYRSTISAMGISSVWVLFVTDMLPRSPAIASRMLGTSFLRFPSSSPLRKVFSIFCCKWFLAFLYAWLVCASLLKIPLCMIVSICVAATSIVRAFNPIPPISGSRCMYFGESVLHNPILQFTTPTSILSHSLSFALSTSIAASLVVTHGTMIWFKIRTVWRRGKHLRRRN